MAKDLKARARTVLAVAKQTLREWKRDDGLQWGAALAYYTIFALAPMLLITLVIAGIALDEAAVQDRILDEVEAVLGDDVRALIETMLAETTDGGSNAFAIGVGIVALLVGATGAFAQLSVALNRMWGIRPDPARRGWLLFLRKRVLAFGFVLVLGVVLLASLVLTTVLTAAGDQLATWTPARRILTRLVAHAVSIVVLTGLFAMIFRFLPDAVVAWRDVLGGALLTAVLFELGKALFGLYLSQVANASRYGAAGALVLILVWVWFASQLVFLGAQLTQVTARRRGAPIEPEPHAVKVVGLGR